MKKTYVDYPEWCITTAESEEEAQRKFWDYIYKEKGLPSDYYEKDTTKEETED